MAFRVGQKMIFIGEYDDAYWRSQGLFIPATRAIYTIRSFEDRGQVPGLRVEEIINPERLHRDYRVFEPAFRCIDFRPVVSTDTGMAILEQIRRDVSNKILRPIFEDEQV